MLFWEALRVKNYSEATIENRTRYLEAFVRWCAERGITQPREVTKPMIERYQRHLYHHRKKDGRPMSFRNQHAHLVAVRSFFKWVTRQNYILYNPASEIDLPRLEQRLPQAVLTAHEAELVLTQPDVRDPLGLRDRAILETFYSTGMRRSELAHLALLHIDHERGTVLIRQGKGKKDRMIPIGDRALQWIDTYTREVRPELVMEPDDGTLFLVQEGVGFSPNRLTQMVRGYVRAAKIGKTGSCHLFRHTMATLMLDGGADVRFIQAMLGHVSLDTTAMYTRVAIRKLKEIHTATHPGAKLERRASAAAPVTPDAPETIEEAQAELLASLVAEEQDGGLVEIEKDE
jgi:integrase/recombinase XerD